MTGFQGYRVVDTLDGAGQEDTGAGAFADFCTDAFNDSRLEDEGGDGRDQDGNRQDRKGRHPFQNQHKRQHWNDEQPGSDAELFGQDGRVQVNLGRLCRRMQQTDDREDDERDDNGRYRREHHISDMREQRDSVDGGGHDGRVRQRGDLVAEVGARDDGAGGPARRETVRRADADEGDADGGHGGPRTARDERHQGADQTCHEKEQRRRDDLHAVVDHGGHDAAQHPAARDGADEEQNEHRGADGFDVVGYGTADGGPFHLVADHGDGHGHGSGKDQSSLAGTVDGVGAELPDDQHLQPNKHYEGY